MHMNDLRDSRGMPSSSSIVKCVDRLRRLAYVGLALQTLARMFSIATAYLVVLLVVTYGLWCVPLYCQFLEGPLFGVVTIPSMFEVSLTTNMVFLLCVGAFFATLLWFEKEWKEALLACERSHEASTC